MKRFTTQLITSLLAYSATMFGMAMPGMAMPGLESSRLINLEPATKVNSTDDSTFIKSDSLVIQHITYLTDTSCTMTFDQVLSVRSRSAPFPGNYNVYQGHYCHWFRSDITNESFQAQSTILTTGYHQYAELYLMRNGKLAEVRQAGNALPLDERDVTSVWRSTYVNTFRLRFPPRSTTTIYVKTHSPYGPNIYGKNTQKLFRFIPVSTIEKSAHQHTFLTGFVQGALWFVFFFHLIQYAISPSRPLLWYCIFLSSITLYLLDKEFLLLQLFPSYVYVQDYVFLIAIGLSYTSFFQFSRKIISLFAEDLIADTALRSFIIANLVFFSSWLGVYTLNCHAEATDKLVHALAIFPDAFRVLSLVEFGGIIILHIKLALTYRTNVIRYYVAANSFILVMMILYFAYAFSISWQSRFITDVYATLGGPAYFVEVGILGQVLLFAITLGYLTRAREKKVEQDFARRTAALKMTALRSQMNPHFLFNSLNSINWFVLKKQSEKASDYLTKFSRLIRMILQNSDLQTIPLSEELTALRLYIEMESLRFEHKFTYKIEVDDSIDARFANVPPMILQPYVENAIWHGLLHKPEGDGHLSVSIHQQENESKLKVVIEDNGVGRPISARRHAERRHAERHHAEQLPSKTATKKKSMGSKIAADRIKALAELLGQKADIQLIDLVDADNLAAGTRVIVEIPTAY
ncbi:histidine kinase [Tunicatimonas pelagia]|uniref:histidine kinase n=1 Tax=Tunicatimonas pelagia TaxID=931531 RepID=UPI002665A63A|nr:histidine kinase [Tunicatimonas pelagia]WKN43037.1 histidine kinase [Tunicatimonas pelagia]